MENDEDNEIGPDQDNGADSSAEGSDSDVGQSDASNPYSPTGVPSGVDAVKAPKQLGQPEEANLEIARGIKTPPAEVAGGPAIMPQGKGAGEQADQPTKADSESGGGVINRGRQVVSNTADTIKDAAKKFAQQAIDKVKKQLTKAALKAIFRWPGTYIILAILLVLLIIVVAFTDSKGSDMDPSGKTPTRTVEPLTDKEWIQKVLVLAGNGDVSKFLATDYLGGLSSDLTLLSSQTKSAEVRAKAEEIQADIVAVKGATDAGKKAAATKLLTDMKALGLLMYSVSPFPSDIPTVSPIEIGKITPELFNTHTHVGTAAYPCGGSTGVSCAKQPNHGGRTFIQFTKNTCDATDIMVAKANVVAAFEGKVVEKSELHFKIRLEKGGHTYEAVYAHLDGSPPVGANVSRGEPIGKVGSAGHLHFELSVDNRCVVASPSDAIEATAAGTKMGYVVWQKMIRVLNLPS